MNEIDSQGSSLCALPNQKGELPSWKSISEEKPSVAEIDAFAQRIGVSRNQFYVIARA